MKRAFRICLTISLFASFFIPSSRVSGSDCKDPTKIFASSYNLVFSFDKKGDAHVSQQVSLKNLVGDCVAKEYALRINSTKIKFISGSDTQGNLSVTTKKDRNSTTLNAKLNDFVIGKNKSVAFKLRYIIRNLAEKQGLVWNLTVPKITASEKVESYKLNLILPDSYGDIFTISPKPRAVKKADKLTTITFGKNKALNRTISASFGDYQEIAFELKTQLTNKGLLNKKFYLPLPADNEQQQILISSAEPKPTKITVDERGNYLAEYNLKGGDSFEVYIKGVAKIAGGAKYFPSIVSATSSGLDEFRSSSRYIQTQDRLIQEKAKQLKDAQSIYDFVVDYLDYNEDAFKNGKSTRRGALNSLSKKNLATNLDFVDLFVALSRATGLPAREVFGLTLGDAKGFKPIFIGEPLNTKNLHVWAQVYDTSSKAWINYDPTWGNTSGITHIREEFSDRFALFVSESGEDIDLLKEFTLSAENVKITGAKKPSNFFPKVDLLIDTDQAFAGFPVELEVKLKNKSGVSVSVGELSIATNNVTLLGRSKIEISPLLPYQTKVYKFKVRAGDIFKTTHGTVTVGLDAQSGTEEIVLTKEKKVTVSSFFSLGVQQILLFLVIVLLIVGAVFPKIQKTFKK
jgi:hypothetical protein